MTVKEIMDTWTLQMGYPVLTIKKENGKYVATQKHFISDYVGGSKIPSAVYG